jgi:hypothetical protein
MKKKEGWCFEKLVIVAIVAVLMVSFAALMAYATDGQEARSTIGPQGTSKASTRGSAILPPAASKVVERPSTQTEPIHNPAGSQMLVAWLTTVPTCDGYIDAAEWADAYVYDISDTTGQQDGIANPLGTVYLWLKQDDNGIYFAIRNNADATLHDYDQCGLYFDDNYDGCWPASPTNEGNNWLVYEATGNWVQWRWIQDYDCSFPPTYACTGDNYGGFYNWSPPCFGIGIGPTGVVDYEVMIPYGTLDEYLDLTMPPDTLGFYVYCLDYFSYDFHGEWPSQGYISTYNEPCYFGRLICEGEEEEWPDHKMHFPQLPDLIGWDVNAIFPKVLADDWQCSQTGPIEDIHFWGSWKDIDGNPYTDDVYTPMPWFGLSIHRNIPASVDTPWSRPGEMIWWWDGEIEGIPFDPPTLEAWFDPNTGVVIPNDHAAYWRYDFFFGQAVPTPDPFTQYEDSIYWLNITTAPGSIPPPYAWGWKNSRDHFMDDAVYTDDDPNTGPWFPLVEPPRQNWFDVYFNSAGVPDDMGSTNFYGQGWYFYEWYSWWNMWFYDNPFTYDQVKEIFLNFYIEEVGPSAYAEFAINWSTPEWDELEMGRPPLPSDGNEDLYIGREVFPVNPGPNSIPFTLPFNPEWVSIDFRAIDVIINGWIQHECVGTSMDMAFVITGPECTPSIDAEKQVCDEENQAWVDSIDMDVCNNAEFLITIHNDGTCCDLTDIVIEDFMDASLEFVSAEPPPDYVDPVPDGTLLGWSFPGPLPPCNTIDITVIAHVVGPACHLDSNYIFVHGACVEQGIEVYDEDVAYVHATGEPWPDHKMHYPQLPDPNGWDIVATMGYDYHPGLVLADDFMCMESGPITDVHIWGSWQWDQEIPILGFWLSIHDNVPAPPYSHPGNELWSAYVTDFEVVPEDPSPQGFFDPYYWWWEGPGNHVRYYRYDMTTLPEPFVQDSGTIYWLNVMADIGPPGYLGFPEPPVWGWKTSRSPLFEDDACWAIWTPPVFEWIPLTDPVTGSTLDLAFVITSTGPSVLCGDANNDGIVDLSDAIWLLNYLFKSGPPPIPYMCVGDVNNDDLVVVGDAIYILNYLFKGGPPPDPNCCNPVWATE